MKHVCEHNITSENHNRSLIRIAKLFATFIIVLANKYSLAQDIHFTQFYQSPFNINPGLCGQFDGDYRFIANQRTQWRSVTVPYNTFGLAVDARNIIYNLSGKSEDQKSFLKNIHTGLSYYTDKAGDSRFKSDMINLFVSKDVSTGDGSGVITPGISIGFTHMKIDYSNLSFDNQWNGFVFDPGINPEEQFARSSRAYLNINLGVNYTKTFSNAGQLQTGIGLFNLSDPKQSFFDDGYVKLDLRSNIYARYKHPINNLMTLEPMVLWMRQGTYDEVNFGGLFYYSLSTTAWNKFSIYGGALGRARDAGNLIAGVLYNEWNVGVSYDINTSNLRPASNGRGGFELSVIYIIPSKKIISPFKYCPDYM